MGECCPQKHTQLAPSVKTECDYLYMQKSHPKWWTPESYLGNVEEEEVEEKPVKLVECNENLLDTHTTIPSKEYNTWTVTTITAKITFHINWILPFFLTASDKSSNTGHANFFLITLNTATNVNAHTPNVQSCKKIQLKEKKNSNKKWRWLMLFVYTYRVYHAVLFHIV